MQGLTIPHEKNDQFITKVTAMNKPAIDLSNPVQTMSSREIAELVESRPDNVKRTIETLSNKGLITFTQTEEKSDERKHWDDVE